MKAHVIDGQIKRLNIPTPRVWGDISFGINATDAEYRAVGLYEIVGQAPAYDSSTQTLQGPQYEVGVDVVNKVYTVIDKTPEVIFLAKKKLVETTVQKMLDDSSLSRGYGSVISECSYATSTGVFGTEAQVTVNWRDAVWQYVFQVEADLIAQLRTEPTLEELLLELPVRL